MATTASIQTAEIESSETDRRDCSAISTPQPSSERPAVDDTRVLRKKERKALSAVLKSLDRKSLCSKVVAKVGSGLHFTCYPERKKFWDCICTSDALRALISATDEFVRLYMAQTRGNKYAKFLQAWLQYMNALSGDRQASESCILLEKCCPQPVSQDTWRVVMCDILHTLQLQLQAVLVKELDDSQETNTEVSSVSVSDDTSLYRIGGWAIHSLLKQTSERVKHTEDVTTLKEELKLLESMKLDDKTSVPPGLVYLDRGGLLFPKQELLPYLRLVEERLLDVLNENNYRRYGKHLFEVSVKIMHILSVNSFSHRSQRE